MNICINSVDLGLDLPTQILPVGHLFPCNHVMAGWLLCVAFRPHMHCSACFVPLHFFPTVHSIFKLRHSAFSPTLVICDERVPLLLRRFYSPSLILLPNFYAITFILL